MAATSDSTRPAGTTPGDVQARALADVEGILGPTVAAPIRLRSRAAEIRAGGEPR